VPSTPSSPLAAVGGRVAQASLQRTRDRYEHEVVTLIHAVHRLTRQRAFDDVTVAEILEEAGLSTRAFYRHFQSKDELLVTMLEYEAELSVAELGERLAGATTAGGRFALWLEWHLDLFSERKRARRAALFQHERNRLAFAFPDRVAAIEHRQDDVLRAILEAGREEGVFPRAEPAHDAPVIRSLVGSFIRPGNNAAAHRDEVRARILRFCLPALGADEADLGDAPRSTRRSSS